MSFDNEFQSVSRSFNSSGAYKHADNFEYVLQLNPRDGSVDQLQALVTEKGWENDVKVVAKEVTTPGTLTAHVRAFALFKDKELAEVIAKHFWAVNKDLGVMVSEQIDVKDISGQSRKKWQLKSATP